MPNAVTRRQKRGKRKKKVDMENSECLVECDWAGEGGGAPIRGQRAGRGGGQSDDAMKKLMTNLRSSAGKQSWSYQICQRNIKYCLTAMDWQALRLHPPAPSLVWKGRLTAALPLVQVNPRELAELAPHPSALFTWRKPSFDCKPLALQGEQRI